MERRCVAGLPDGWVDAQAAAAASTTRRSSTARRRCSAPLAAVRARPTASLALPRRDATAAGRGVDGRAAARPRSTASRIAGTLELVVLGRGARRPRRRAAPAADACPSRGTPRSRRCRPTGATCSARSSSARPTTSSARRSISAPINPRRDGDRSALRFRCARTVGYGASPEMVRRCLERCDDDEHPSAGAASLRALSRHAAGADAGPGLADGGEHRRQRRGLRALGHTLRATQAQCGRSRVAPLSARRAARRRTARRARRRSRRADASRPPRRACARATGTRPRTRPTCGPRRPARRGRRRRRGSRAAPARPPRARRRRARRRRRPPGTDDGDVLPHGRVGDHVLVGDRLVRGREEVLEVELERAPLAVEQPRVQLADDARRGCAPPCPDGAADARRARTSARP